MKSQTPCVAPQVGLMYSHMPRVAPPLGDIDSHTPCEAGLDPCGHLWVTSGVYLCTGKPPLADIILSHPPDLT